MLPRINHPCQTGSKTLTIGSQARECYNSATMPTIDKARSLNFKGNSLVTYLQEVRQELMKVSWPTRQEVIKLSLIVLGSSLVVGLYISGIDYLFTQIIGSIIQ